MVSQRVLGRTARCDVAVIGGGLGGVAAALAAASAGASVIVTEETRWIGGQLTAQGVPPDENRWIESIGGTATYRAFRRRVREYYRRNFPLSAKAASEEALNPGNAWVSRIAHDPRVGLAVLYEMLAPHLASGRVRLWLRHTPLRADVDGDTIRSVELRDLEAGGTRTLEAPVFLDATELGDLLPLSGAEYVTGAESQDETGEPHAVPGPAEPLNMQAITHCFAVEHVPGGDFTIERPASYDFWRSHVPALRPAWPGRLLDWAYTHPPTGEVARGGILSPPAGVVDLWRYRRIADPANFEPGFLQGDLVIVNWPQNDYMLGPIVEVPEEEAARHRRGAKELSLSLLYWLQTEAPRPDGGAGYPGLRLRGDVFGTADGLALYPYIRESRRIRARFTVLEQHLSRAERGKLGPVRFADSVGIGHYRIDLHPTTGGNNYIDFPVWPFQIPLGSLIPVRMRNLLAAGKNLGVTHVTNGCYRLHPVEWNVGEASGHLAALAVERRTPPAAFWEDQGLLEAYQSRLVAAGIPLAWPEEVLASV